MDNFGRARALQALKDAERFIVGVCDNADNEAKRLVDVLKDEAQRVHQAGLSLVLAVIADEYIPVSQFKAWASVRTFRNWRDDPEIKLMSSS